jgi:hypothetical protein
MAGQQEKPSAFERFEHLTKRLLGVEKQEIEEKEKERKKAQRRKPKASD